MKAFGLFFAMIGCVFSAYYVFADTKPLFWIVLFLINFMSLFFNLTRE